MNTLHMNEYRYPLSVNTGLHTPELFSISLTWNEKSCDAVSCFFLMGDSSPLFVFLPRNSLELTTNLRQCLETKVHSEIIRTEKCQLFKCTQSQSSYIFTRHICAKKLFFIIKWKLFHKDFIRLIKSQYTILCITYSWIIVWT